MCFVIKYFVLFLINQTTHLVTCNISQYCSGPQTIPSQAILARKLYKPSNTWQISSYSSQYHHHHYHHHYYYYHHHHQNYDHGTINNINALL